MSFGIGQGASQELVKGIATKGLSRMIRDSADMEAEVLDLLSDAQTGLYRDIQVSYSPPQQGLATLKMEPISFERVFRPGGRFQVFLEFEGLTAKLAAETDGLGMITMSGLTP